MKTFVVGFLNLHVGELQLTKVNANSPYEAMIQVTSWRDYEGGPETEDAVYSYAADCDCYISCLEV